MGTAFERLHRLITRLGAWPSAIEPDTHDVVMASVSHLPHVLANVLVAQAARVLGDGGRAAAGHRPVVSRRDPRRGRQLGHVGRHLPRQRRRAGGRDRRHGRAPAALPRPARERRRRRHREPGTTPRARTAGACWKPTSPAARSHELRVLVPNRPGIVAEIALALGRATIDIVDIGLYPSIGLARHGRAVDPRRRRRPAGRAARARPGPGGGARVNETRPAARSPHLRARPAAYR